MTGVNLLPLVGEPVVGVSGDAFSLVCREQLFQIFHPHGATDNFAHTGHQTVDAFGDSRVLGILLHVESLDLDGEVGQENRGVDNIRHLPLGSLGDVIAELMRLALFIEDAVLVEPFDSLDVFHASEGALRRLELVVFDLGDFFPFEPLLLLAVGLLVELLDESADLRVGPDVVDRPADHLLEVLQKVVEGDEGQFGLDVGVLAQMAAGERLLGAERLLDAEYVAERWEARFEVQLRRLSKVCLFHQFQPR
jgi:hypothetical protein